MSRQQQSQLVHLVRLLDDTDARMQDIVRKELIKNSLEIVLQKHYLLGHIPANALENVQQLLWTLHNELVEHAFYQVVRQPGDDVDLEKAMAVLSYWNDPFFDYRELKDALDRMAGEIGTFLPSSGHPLVFLDHLNFILFSRHKFRGNRADYYNPDNIYLDRVLKSKKGIPISLSIVYLLLAHRLNLPIYGVSMPSHFLLKFYNGEDEIFFDAFNEGKIYSRNECLRFLENAHHAEPETVLNGCDNREIVARVLRNLKVIYAFYKPDDAKLQFVEHLLSFFS